MGGMEGVARRSGWSDFGQTTISMACGCAAWKYSHFLVESNCKYFLKLHSQTSSFSFPKRPPYFSLFWSIPIIHRPYICWHPYTKWCGCVYCGAIEVAPGSPWSLQDPFKTKSLIDIGISSIHGLRYVGDKNIIIFRLKMSSADVVIVPV